MIELIGLIPLTPFLGFLVLAFSAGQLSKSLVAWIGVGSVGVSCLLAALIGAEFLQGTQPAYHLVFGYWLSIADLSAPFGFYLDALSVTMLFVVTGVGFLIHLYSAEFMAAEIGYARFFACMNLFVASMLVLVLADNLLLLYLGWEGVGLGSYLLIGFWYSDANNGYAARKAFVMTRAGDAALLVGLLLLFTQLHTVDIQSLMAQITQRWTSGGVMPVAAAALLLGGAVGKSAQLPLQTWLPDAMAGPTPVSALIHAATMVTAGVYLIARTHVLFAQAPVVQSLVAVLGTLTLLLAGCSALAQTDIKRILAYSTISQLGYMFLALGVGAWSASIFHLLTHAFFKALLFLAAGAVIAALHHEHNIFRMGGLRKIMPLAFWSFLIGSAALSGLPFTAGFYSKHEILQAAYASSAWLWAFGCLGAMITGIYSFRLVFTVFFGREYTKGVKQHGWRMRIPLIVLCGLALGGGLLQMSLDSVFSTLVYEKNPHKFDLVSIITATAPFIGLLIAILFYLTRTISPERLCGFGWAKQVQSFWFKGWGMDGMYDYLVVQPFKTLSTCNRNDLVDTLYTRFAWLCRHGSQLLSTSQTGRMRWYATSMVLGTVLIITLGCWL
ncbi:NADH-quinone oxidoreductase subunit L [Methylomonas sp. AM2-LC]|uniref:NADH-quinone oxidoreductase subunit L n=1 Tax=Methylomonas sp. AM2-LC TaxID=3153301 RepID=UPI0032645975